YLLAACLLLAILQPACATGKGPVAAALVNPARSAADRERDLRDKPLQVLNFAGFRDGMTIADVFGGGGYYSEILSGVVGENGKVLLINNAPYDAYVDKDVLAARLDNGRLPNVEYMLVKNEAMGLGSNSLDGAMIIMSYHDLFYDDPEGGWPDVGHDQFIDQIVTALKPGGRLLIVDHAAKAGSDDKMTESLHRIDEQFAIDQLQMRGLTFVGSIPDLRNDDDNRELTVFDPEIRGKTDRFVHLYTKGGASGLE
ncbi:MAG: hypothetical protein WBN34_08225, partial [Woeseia sp.]